MIFARLRRIFAGIAPLFVGVFLFVTPALARELYVDSGAEAEGDGSQEAPLTTLNEAIPLFVDGENNTVYATGSFAEYVHLTSAEGGVSEETRTTFRDWPGRTKPVNDATYGDREGKPIHNVFNIDNADYVTVQGFEVIGGVNTNIWFTNGSAFGIAQDNITYGAGVKGICFRDAPDGKILNNISYENDEIGIFVPNPEADRVLVEGNIVHHNGISGIEARNGADAITIRGNEVYSNNTTMSFTGGGIVVESAYRDTDAVIENNYLHDEIKAIAIGPRVNTRIVGNRIERTTDTGINVRQAEGIEISRNTLTESAFGISLYGTNRISLDANTVRGATMRPAVSFMESHHVSLANNMIVDNGFAGVSIQSTDHVAVTNNTFANQGVAIRLEGSYVTDPHVKVFNNIFAKHNIVYSLNTLGHERFFADYNSYYANGLYLTGRPGVWSPERACLGQGKECRSFVGVDPQFRDSDAGDYHLRWTSPLVGAAWFHKAPMADIDGNERGTNGKADIGADEAFPNSEIRKR